MKKEVKIAMITVFLLLSMASISAVSAGPYSTAMNNTNTGATDPGIPGKIGGSVNPVFVGWATTVVNYTPSNQTNSYKNASKALGPVTGTNTDIVSLGDLTAAQIAAGELPGSITLGFNESIANGDGADFAVFENGFGSQTSIFAELGYVEVSTDGINFVRFPSVSLTSSAVGAYGNIDPTNVYNLVGKHANAYSNCWGTPLDLNDLLNSAEVLNGLVNLNNINYVRIVDIPGNGSFLDYLGNPIYDAWVTTGSGGVDLEAVGVIHTSSQIPIAEFSGAPTSGTAPLQVTFTNTSTGTITSYAWDFDNNGTTDSTDTNPFWTYNTPGTYTVKLTVTGPGGSDDEVKTDYITVFGTPDLLSGDLQVPSSPIIAIAYPVSATVTNSGTADVSAFIVKLYDNNTQVAKINLTGLASGASTPVTFNWTPTTTGNHVLAITADTNNEITESNETNNLISTEVSVNPSTQPDLTVTNLQISTNPTIGTTYPVIVTVTNQGTVNADAFTVKLYDNNTQIAKINLTELAAGASTDVTFNWLTYTTGTHNLSVIADASCQISEYNESNNQISQQVSVGASTQPDLTVTDLQIPANPTAGTTYQITVTVTNNGTVDAAAFAVKLYDNNTQVMKVNLTGLAAGTSTQVTFNWTPTTGTHNLLVKADANNQITEYNENNNTITRQTTLS